MESKSSSGGDLTPSDAQAALDALSADRSSLADRVRAPRWYNPALGAIVAILVGSPGVGSGSLRSSLVALTTVALMFLILGYKQVTGVSVTIFNGGARSRAGGIVVGVIVLLLFLGSLALAATGRGPWIGATAAAAFLTMVIGGAAVDRAYAEELRDGR